MVRCSRDRTIYSCDLVLTSLMSSSSNILHCCCEPYQCFRKLKAPWLLPPPAARTGCITYIPAKVNASCCIQLQCKGMLHYMYIYIPLRNLPLHNQIMHPVNVRMSGRSIEHSHPLPELQLALVVNKECQAVG